MSEKTSTDNKNFLLEKVLKNYSGIFDKKTEDRLIFLRREKIERPHIYIGTSTCGVISGALHTWKAVEQFILANHMDVELIAVGCAGLCSAEPLLDIQLPGKSRVSFHHVTEDKVENLLQSVFHRTIPEDMVLGQYRSMYHEGWANLPYMDQLPFFALQHRNILRNAGLISPRNIDDYLAWGGYRALYKTVLNYTADKVCEIAEQSQLRGRSGSGYLTGKKWKVALDTAGDKKFLICNADESDPGAFMNRALIESDPHRVLEGIAIAAYACGASHAFVYIRSNPAQPFEILEHAMLQAKEYGFLGENIFGSGFNLSVQIRQGAGAFVCGEETALIASLEGNRGLPKSKPPYPAEIGYQGYPTIVNNVETLANIPSIIENGPSWFKAIGSKESKGTKILSISGMAVHSGYVEVPMGIPISEIVNKIAGGVRNSKPLKAILLGGTSGIFIPAQDMERCLGYEFLHEIGASLGSGGLIVLDDSVCMVSLSKYLMEFLQNESCGKCIPCREGTKRMLEILDAITRRPKEESSHKTLERFKGVVQLENLAEVIRDTSLCGLGQHAPNPVLSSLKWFREEYEEHIFDRRCAAGVCHDLRTFFIDPEVCNGCNVCQRKCPENAIIGSIKMPHFIIEVKCTGCGICYDSCKFNAIYYK